MTCILHCKVVGTKFHKGKDNLHLFKVGAPVKVVPEPTNKYDDKAIAIYDESGKVMLGYIPRAVNRVVHLSGHLNDCKGVVTEVYEGLTDPIRIEVFTEEDKDESK